VIEIEARSLEVVSLNKNIRLKERRVMLEEGKV